MGKKGKHKSVVNFGQFQKEKNNKLLSEQNYTRAFLFGYEDMTTVEDKERISPMLLHTILYTLDQRDTLEMDGALNGSINDLIEAEVFENSKAKVLYQRGKYTEAALEILQHFKRKYPNILLEAFDIWCNLCYIIFKYADKTLDKLEFCISVQQSLSYNVMRLVMALQLEKIIAIECKTNEKLREHTESCIREWDKLTKDFVLDDSLLNVKYWDKETVREFVAIYNGILRSWKDTKDGSEDKRNTEEAFFSLLRYKEKGISVKKDIIVNSKDDEERLIQKWMPLFEVCKKQGVRQSFFNEQFTNFSKELISQYEEDTHLEEIIGVFTKVIWSAEGYFNNTHPYFVSLIFMNLASKCNKELVESKDEQIKNLNETVKEYKNQNRTLNKSVNSLEAEKEKDKKRITALETEITTLKESVCANEEFTKLETEYKGVKETLEVERETHKKEHQKMEWQEKRIKELEEELKGYSTIEMDMMALQNENNSILGQIKRIEDLENLEDAETEYNRKLEAIKNEPIFFVGGTGNLMARFKDIFVNSDYLDVSESTENFEIPQRFKYVVIYTKQVSHAHCGRVESQVDRSKIILMSICNTKLVVDELYKKIVGHK